MVSRSRGLVKAAAQTPSPGFSKEGINTDLLDTSRPPMKRFERDVEVTLEVQVHKPAGLRTPKNFSRHHRKSPAQFEALSSTLLGYDCSLVQPPPLD